jgi:hypothetical protein
MGKPSRAKQRRKRPGQGKPPRVQPRAPLTESGQKPRQGRSGISFLWAVCCWAYRHVILNVIFWAGTLGTVVTFYTLRPKVVIDILESADEREVFYSAVVRNNGELSARNVKWKIHVDEIEYDNQMITKNFTIDQKVAILKLDGGNESSEVLWMTLPIHPDFGRIVRGKIRVEIESGWSSWDIFRSSKISPREAYHDSNGKIRWRPASRSLPAVETE